MKNSVLVSISLAQAFFRNVIGGTPDVRILADSSDCGGCNSGECVEPLFSSEYDESVVLGELAASFSKPICRCKGTGFIGEHCDIPCSKDCQNGGKCVPATGGRDEETCSCTKAVVDGNPYAGASCEYGATKSCMKLGSQSKHSFCTNWGECAGIVGDNDEHINCICENKFAGDHCEYATGSAPALARSSSEGAVIKNTTSGLNRVAVGFITLLSLLIVGLLVAFYARSKRQRKLSVRRRDEVVLTQSLKASSKCHLALENQIL